MRRIKTFMTNFLVVASMVSFISCHSGKGVQTTEVKGMVLDATMNNIMVVTVPDGDTVSVCTMYSDAAEVPGVLVSDSVSIQCMDSLINGVSVLCARKLTVTTHSPYFYIQGTWTEPIPGQAGSQGFTLKEDGSAVSVGMATLQYARWNLEPTDQGSSLMLSGQSIGNGITLDFNDTLSVIKLNADSLVLANKSGAVVWNLARTK